VVDPGYGDHNEDNIDESNYVPDCEKATQASLIKANGDQGNRKQGNYDVTDTGWHREGVGQFAAVKKVE
jgi:hypothetical protein